MPLTILACLTFAPIGVFAVVRLLRANDLRALGAPATGAADRRCRTSALIAITTGLTVAVVALLAIAL